MHELSVTQALLRQVETVAAQHDSHRVVAITDALRVPKLINGLAEKVSEIGMSPFKF